MGNKSDNNPFNKNDKIIKETLENPTKKDKKILKKYFK